MSKHDPKILGNPEVAQFFFEKLFAKDSEEDCWLWHGNSFPKRGGYGAFTCRALGVRMVRAHRAAWLIYKREPLKPRQHILHRCDTPKCVNPDHLFLGDQTVNMADKTKKGRQNRGETHGKAKLTENDIRAIRADTRLHREIAADYGVTFVTISDIKRRRSWAHLD